MKNVKRKQRDNKEVWNGRKRKKIDVKKVRRKEIKRRKLSKEVKVKETGKG